MSLGYILGAFIGIWFALTCLLLACQEFASWQFKRNSKPRNLKVVFGYATLQKKNPAE